MSELLKKTSTMSEHNSPYSETFHSRQESPPSVNSPSSLRQVDRRRLPLSNKCSVNDTSFKSRKRRRKEVVDGTVIKHAKREFKTSPSHDGSGVNSNEEPCVDQDGYLVVRPGMVLNERYKVKHILGEGSFGRVVSCEDIDDPKQLYAIKISRITDDQSATAAEATLLEKMADWDPEHKQRVLCLRERFSLGEHVCLVFDLLGPSIYDFMKGNNYIPYPMRHIKQIAKQLCETVKFLHEHGMIHTDLKPENILFESGDATVRFSRSANREVYVLKEPSIRLIDFGSAVCKGEKHPVTISTRHYRAPEVVLELKWSSAADMWSIGCILLELYTGDCIFMTHSRLEHLAMMERLLGRIPKHMVRATPREEYFYHDRLDWEKGSRKGRRVREMVLRLEDYIPRHPTKDEIHFFDLLSKLLVFEPSKRADIHTVLRHPFLSEP